MKPRCEMRSAHVLRRSGWSPELFKSREKVDITASPDRADVASCYLQTIVFANGSRMDRYGQYVKAPTGGVKEVRGPIKQANLNRPARGSAAHVAGAPALTGFSGISFTSTVDGVTSILMSSVVQIARFSETIAART